MNLVFKLDVELVSQLKLAKDPIKDKRYVDTSRDSFNH